MQETSSSNASPSPDDTAEQARRWARIAEMSGRVSSAFWQRQAKAIADREFQFVDPAAIGKAFSAFTVALWSNPDKHTEASAEFFRQGAELWGSTARRLQGNDADHPEIPADRRFRGDAWEESAIYDHLRRAYLLTSEWMQNLVKDTDGVDPKDREKVAFYTRQFVSAASPANFVATNPEVLGRTMETNGANLVTGLEHLLADLEKGRGELRISMTDENAFRVGENVAATPGKVVYQNELMQLIQYEPSTERVARRPLLFIPHWINKYYVLDLRPKNSLIKWATDQGHTLFVISWVNPREDLAHKTFEDYLREGPLEAIDAIERATGEREVNVLGFCIGGILTVTALALLGARGDSRIASATLLATLFDFDDVGEIGIFVDEDQIERIEQYAAEKGYLEGKHMTRMFSMMRENDLIWSFVVNNYLMGRQPIPFDLLYWNADSTHLPAAMLAYYLRKFYLENGLAKPGHIVLDGVPIDLKNIEVPCYILATKDDHIAPWRSSWSATQRLASPVRFVLGGSGHIAGVINPPAAGKYCYWTGNADSASPDAWLEQADRHEGSWWDDWGSWLSEHAGGEVEARQPGEGNLEPLEDAPGSYVLERVSS